MINQKLMNYNPISNIIVNSDEFLISLSNSQDKAAI